MQEKAAGAAAYDIQAGGERAGRRDEKTGTGI